MTENETKKMLETTTEIKQGHAGIGKLNLVVIIVMTLICVGYLILHFTP